MPDQRTKRRRLYGLGALIFCVGLALAAWVHAHAQPDPDVLGYEIANGVSYPISVADSKTYQRDLERIGGKTAILLDDINRWFASLWQGRRLATTLLLIAAALALFCFWLAETVSEDG